MKLTKSIVIPVVMVVAFSMLAMAMTSLVYMRWFTPVVIQPVLMTVKQGQTATQVLKQIAQVTDYQFSNIDKLLFKRYPSLLMLKAGEYKLQQGDSVFQVLSVIEKGVAVLHSIALVEGLTAKQWIQQLTENPLVDCRQFDLQQYVNHSQWNPAHIEGRLLPDTYRVSKNTKITELFDQAHLALSQYLHSAWQERSDNLPYQSPYQALIMASIIEKETGVASERPRISAVFVNRLRLGMRLQTDPTVIYGMGDTFDGNIRRADLRRPTPYNTYVIKGLPPTPIAMASRAAIDAALHPIESDELYFVSKGDGSHYFSTNLKQHNEAVYRYQIKKR